MRMRGLFLSACGALLTMSAAHAQYEPRDQSSPAERAQTDALNRQQANSLYSDEAQTTARGESTPAERAQTRALNQQQVNAGPLPPVPPTPPVSPDPQAQSRYRTQLEDYNQQVRDYNRAQLEAYDRRMQNYREQQRSYEQAQNRYRDQREAYAGTFSDTDITEQGPAVRYRNRMLLLNELANPDREIYDVPVTDRRGDVVGHFLRLQREPDGDLAVITLSDNRTVSVPIERLLYDRDRRQVVTELDANEIARF